MAQSSMLKRWYESEGSRYEHRLEKVENHKAGKKRTPIVRPKRIVVTQQPLGASTQDGGGFADCFNN